MTITTEKLFCKAMASSHVLDLMSDVEIEHSKAVSSPKAMYTCDAGLKTCNVVLSYYSGKNLVETFEFIVWLEPSDDLNSGEFYLMAEY